MSRMPVLIGVALVVCFAAGLAAGWLLPVRQQPVGPTAPSSDSPAPSPSPRVVYLPKESTPYPRPSGPMSLVKVEHWAYRYSGGPIDCWLDVEETGQQTQNNWVFTGKGGSLSFPLASEGTIHFMIRHPLYGPEKTPGAPSRPCSRCRGEGGRAWFRRWGWRYWYRKWPASRSVVWLGKAAPLEFRVAGTGEGSASEGGHGRHPVDVRGAGTAR
jgi:hypothetical protein